MQKIHRSRGWGKCTYTVRCEFDGTYSLIQLSGIRRDLAEGDHWEYAMDMFRALQGLAQTNEQAPHTHMTIGRYFRWKDARPFHVYRRLDGMPMKDRRYACTVDFAPEQDSKYRLLGRNPIVASVPFLQKLHELMTVPIKTVIGGYYDKESGAHVTTITEVKLGHVDHYIASSYAFGGSSLCVPLQVIGYTHVSPEN